LHTSRHIRRSLGALVAVAAAILALGASSAMAAVHWSDTAHGVKVAGSLTATKGGVNKTCTPIASSQKSEFLGSIAYIHSGISAYLRFDCGSSTHLDVWFTVSPTSTTSVQVGEYTGVPQDSPWGSYKQAWVTGQPMTADFANGSGATPSKMTFSKDELGFMVDESGAITLTGSLNVTTSTGGLLTLLP
jgi:hypothetical protein